VPELAGSITLTITKTALTIGKGQVVGLAPSGSAQAAQLGLLRELPDGMDLIQRRLTSYPSPMNFDPTLSPFLISFTHGQVGCLVGLMEILLDASIHEG
jgi:hypothetical protein